MPAKLTSALETKYAGLAVTGVEAEGVFEGYASLFGEADTANDVVEPGAFRASLAKRGPGQVRMLFQHDPKEIVGVWQSLAEDGRGLKVRGRLLTELARGAELHALLRAGALDGLSIGYRAVEAHTDPRTGLRRLERVDLYEISLVTFPMLGSARIGTVKGRTPTMREFERLLTREAGLTRAEAKAVMADGFKALTARRDARGREANAAFAARIRRAARGLAPDRG
jgi:hypothetical protein